MSSLLILIPIALLFFGIIVGLLVWTISRGQYDDLDTPATMVLLDNDSSQAPTAVNSVKTRDESASSS